MHLICIFISGLWEELSDCGEPIRYEYLAAICNMNTFKVTWLHHFTVKLFQNNHKLLILPLPRTNWNIYWLPLRYQKCHMVVTRAYVYNCFALPRSIFHALFLFSNVVICVEEICFFIKWVFGYVQLSDISMYRCFSLLCEQNADHVAHMRSTNGNRCQ